MTLAATASRRFGRSKILVILISLTATMVDDLRPSFRGDASCAQEHPSKEKWEDKKRSQAPPDRPVAVFVVEAEDHATLAKILQLPLIHRESRLVFVRRLGQAKFVHLNKRCLGVHRKEAVIPIPRNVDRPWGMGFLRVPRILEKPKVVLGTSGVPSL